MRWLFSLVGFSELFIVAYCMWVTNCFGIRREMFSNGSITWDQASDHPTFQCLPSWQWICAPLFKLRLAPYIFEWCSMLGGPRMKQIDVECEEYHDRWLVMIIVLYMYRHDVMYIFTLCTMCISLRNIMDCRTYLAPYLLINCSEIRFILKQNSRMLPKLTMEHF